ncbi:hypothetical protein DO97_06005 [Neosynechococcus sphagnicola sy1]|uniref:Response regulatory domain-containing protein n=1 Tax=Neosynechococcus sphagnicola sy1 TaxID=1497020 RepID=A0A098TNR2_9CYAN|nr:response regulator [Neosynechococcus sphagnicola]KGF73901.1 hypothetical protein DO97_06005 [Neosynechococcus sphagnicola sy1]
MIKATLQNDGHPSSVKILVVEDNKVNQKLALKQLKVLGYVADVASDGQEALQRMDQDTYDIVLMDCQMPILDGYDTTRVIRQREGVHRQTVVIAITANTSTADREKCRESGMDDFLSKPVTQEDLSAILNHWIQHIVRQSRK